MLCSAQNNPNNLVCGCLARERERERLLVVVLCPFSRTVEISVRSSVRCSCVVAARLAVAHRVCGAARTSLQSAHCPDSQLQAAARSSEQPGG